MSVSSYGQETPLAGHSHTMMMHAAPDARQAADFSPAMQQHMLSNMRSHLVARSDILLALSKAEYSRAAELADERLGLQSAGATACTEEDGNPVDAPKMSGIDPDREMGTYMPAVMPKLGLAMHQSASDFAAAARKAARTGNAKPAMAALYQVTQNCVACHAAYRIR